MGTMTVVEIVGWLKAHEERTCGQSESAGGQLLLTHEFWQKWISKQGTNGSSNQKARGGYDNRGKGNGHFKLGNGGKGRHGQRDNVCSWVNSSRHRSKVKYFNCKNTGTTHLSVENHVDKRSQEQNWTWQNLMMDMHCFCVNMGREKATWSY